MPDESQSPPADADILERDKRLSECLLWKMLEDFYDHAGLTAWNEIPFYPTSNAFIGDSYADLIVAYLRDLVPRLDRAEPVYVIEMGSGSGLLSFYVLHALTPKLAYFPELADVKLRYVMTDFTDSNVSTWKGRRELAPYRDAGLLDFAQFRPETDREMTLRLSGATISEATVKNPIIGIANYFFDSIKQEFFRIDRDKVAEGRVTFYRSGESKKKGQPPRFDELEKVDRFVDVKSDYYEDPRLNALLSFYGRTLGNASVLLPIGAFDCIRNLERLGHGDLMLLSTDKGFSNIDYMSGESDVPYLAHHGVLSFMVNYNAIARFFTDAAGIATVTAENYGLNSMVGVLRTKKDLMPNTRHYLDQTFERRNPITNLYSCTTLLDRIDTDADASTVFQTAIALIQLANYDSFYFSRAGSRIYQVFNKLQWHEKDVLKQILPRVEESLYPSSLEKPDALFLLREFYYGLDLFERCIATCKRSIEDYGPDANSCYYLGACAEVAEKWQDALDHYREALALDPENELTKEGVARMEAKLSGLATGQ